MRKNSDLVSLALAAAALAAAILLSPWAAPARMHAVYLRPAALPPLHMRLAVCPTACGRRAAMSSSRHRRTRS